MNEVVLSEEAIQSETVPLQEHKNEAEHVIQGLQCRRVGVSIARVDGQLQDSPRQDGLEWQES